MPHHNKGSWGTCIQAHQRSPHKVLAYGGLVCRQVLGRVCKLEVGLVCKVQVRDGRLGLGGMEQGGRVRGGIGVLRKR